MIWTQKKDGILRLFFVNRNIPFTSEQTRFKAHSENICGLIENAGILFRPYAHPSLMFFSQLSSQEQCDVLRNMMSYYQICLDTFNLGQSLKEPPSLTRHAFSRLGFDEDEKLISLIGENELVEMYNLQQTQIYRSMKLYELTSYTMEDLYCRKWYSHSEK